MIMDMGILVRLFLAGVGVGVFFLGAGVLIAAIKWDGGWKWQ